MKIYDISQEVFHCEVYPGDPVPKMESLSRMDQGDLYNLSGVYMCAHNGTHIDAPYHFYKDGKTVDMISLEKFVGMAYVAEHTGPIGSDDALKIVEKAKMADPHSARRILIKGNAVVSMEAAKVFVEHQVILVGNESQTVGPEEAPMEVHLELLGAEMVLLEGIRLKDVKEGAYFLNAAPINLGSADGAPCRAILVDFSEDDGK